MLDPENGRILLTGYLQHEKSFTVSICIVAGQRPFAKTKTLLISTKLESQFRLFFDSSARISEDAFPTAVQDYSNEQQSRFNHRR